MAVEQKTQHRKTKTQATNLDHASLYINRELSWLQFNSRVLEEALCDRHPLLERVKFLAIYAANLDEFFMIRVSGLRRQTMAPILETPPDGMMPRELLTAIRHFVTREHARMTACWRDDILPKLHEQGIRIVDYHQLSRQQQKYCTQFFERDIFSILTPLAFDTSHPFPFISNRSLNLALVIQHPRHEIERFARLKVPDSFPRLLPVPRKPRENPVVPDHSGDIVWVWIEDVIAANLSRLFPGVKVLDVYPFRITRDADISIEEDEASDLLNSVEVGLEAREFARVIRLEVAASMPERIQAILLKNLQLESYLLYETDGRLGMADVMELTKLDYPQLKDEPFLPCIPPEFTPKENIFTVLRRQNIMLYHPYDSFLPVVEFIRQAAHDPHVLGIKQTLYRVGNDSPIVRALLEAREAGKQVAVLVELKARFDEENNIAWARALEEEGVHVVYGLVGLKTHAKVTMVVRREPEGLQRYIHLSTGNYNATTAKIYTDIGLFTTDDQIAADVSDLFNALTGYADKRRYRKLLVAPYTMRRQILARIDREIACKKACGHGRIIFKLNSLVDKACIKALYRASQAGVKVLLQVRGICCLRPGIAGVSDHITVTSIVGRFLEHTRIFYFYNGGDEDILLGSADLMPRNMDGRVEVLFPVDDPALNTHLRDDILYEHLKDTENAWLLSSDGGYTRLRGKGDRLFDSQRAMMERHSERTCLGVLGPALEHESDLSMDLS